MNPDEFAKLLGDQAEKIQHFMHEDMPEHVGHLAVEHFKENFQVEGFVDKSKEPWKEVKRRMDPRGRGARATRKILTGETGELGDSISFEKPAPGQVLIFSDKPYALAHNEGTETAGRGHSTTIPKRQFIGESEALNQKVQHKIEEGIDRIVQGK